MSQPVTALLPPGDESLFRLAVELAPEIGPLTPAQEARLKTLAAGLNPLF